MTDRRRFKGTCKTKHHIVVAYLWEEYPRYVPAHELDKLTLPYGHLGNSGEVRARELARNDEDVVAAHRHPELRDKVERKRGGEIGLDPRYAYYRYREQPSREDHLRIARDAVAAFDALPN